mmetsp:Transcript_38047/g.92572  ORF Transcript_38047/g.92572 Transcript_38047/m.92572 type:complete len:284 (-) Transcript_38047:82-933(-)
MLAADKLQLQSALKQQATALKEKEFNLHHTNLMTVGTQAAVLAGLDITMFIEFTPPHNSEWGEDMALFARFLKFCYYFTIVGAFCANMIVVSQTTTLGVLGAGLALRGPDGSMMTATDGLYEERSSVFMTFGIGLACTVGSVVTLVWIMLSWEGALICMLLTLYTARTIWRNFKRVQDRFDFDENETVDFRDIMEGPAAIQAVPWDGRRGNSGNRSGKYRPTSSKFSDSKKSSSMPLEVDDGSSDDTSWSNHRSQSKRLLNVKQRRSRSPVEDLKNKKMIQTV